MIIAITKYNMTLYQHLLKQAFRLRHKIFNEGMKWGLPAKNGEEFDLFDYKDAVHFLYIDDATNEVIGYWRLMPTMGAYLTEQSFKFLFPKGQVIRDEAVWESSRFCIDMDYITEHDIIYKVVVRSLYSAVMEFCYTHKIRELLSVIYTEKKEIFARILGDALWESDPYALKDGKELQLLSHAIPAPAHLYALVEEFGIAGPALSQFRLLKPISTDEILQQARQLEMACHEAGLDMSANLIGAALMEMSDGAEQKAAAAKKEPTVTHSLAQPEYNLTQINDMIESLMLIREELSAGKSAVERQLH